MNYIYVMMGGAIGALLRYGVSRLCAGVTFLALPVGTLVVNLAGCLLLGLLTGFAEQHVSLPRGLMLMLTVGLCGAFTTFSTFSAENVRMMENGQVLTVLLYVTLSIVIGFLLFFLGKQIVW